MRVLEYWSRIVLNGASSLLRVVSSRTESATWKYLGAAFSKATKSTSYASDNFDDVLVSPTGEPIGEIRSIYCTCHNRSSLVSVVFRHIISKSRNAVNRGLFNKSNRAVLDCQYEVTFFHFPRKILNAG